MDEMEVRVVKKSDVPEIAEWINKRKMNPLPEGVYPEMGFIIHGVGALWVYLTDSDFALLEGLVTNPEISATKAHKGMLYLIDTAERYARSKRKRVLVMTKKEKLSALMERRGFRSIGSYELLTKEEN